MPQKREMRLVFEWINKFHLQALKWRNQRVGKIPEGKNPELYASLRRYADAIFYENDTVHIVEAKIVPKANVIFDLKDYKMRFEETPDFIQYRGKPIKMVFLSAIHDDYVAKLCKQEGIEFVVYTPEWIKTYLREKGYRI